MRKKPSWPDEVLEGYMKQFAIIGLGNFGYFLATQLYEKGHDVLVIDKNPTPVQDIKDSVSQAVVADATDRKALESLGIKNMDAVIVCTGTVLSDSILIALNLKDMGVSNILAKAISDSHSRILFKIGVSDVFFPEKDQAISLSERLHNPNILEYLPFIEGYSIVELAASKGFVGKTLQELDLRNRYGVQVVAIRELVPDQLNLVPRADSVLKESDIMILIGSNESLDKLRKEKK